MTAPLDKKYRLTKREKPVTDFMQTVQLDYLLNRAFMKWTDVHQKDSSGRTALYWAIYHNNMYNIRILLEFGSTLDVLDSLKAPFWAVACRRLEILKYFLGKGIDPNILNRGQTLLEYAADLKHTEIVDYLHKLRDA